MNGQDIITAFELQVGDTTDLSSVEELALLNKKYKAWARAKPWEITKKAASGTTSTDPNVAYISIPADFAFFVANRNHTDESWYANRPVVFIGANYDPYYVVSWSDRRQYRGRSNVCYLDLANSRLVFETAPAAGSAYEFDYHSVPADLTLSTSPVFPSDFAWYLVHAMAADDFVVQLFDKNKSYADENTAKANAYMGDMNYWNANLVQM